MGVFAWLLRRSKATEEAPAAQARADAPDAAGAETGEKPGSAEAKGSSEAPQAAKPAAQSAEAAGTEAVEIPKQQSTEEAADNEAGEGART
ncbi:hypothetical protein AB0K80_23880 [Streptomyces sp. NPDC052682]|uniref:hypothetical protein n=1 Tax=Streptomyces sp. NPDC052682 TaxID=3154954 RepID=UPI003414FAD9